MKLSNPVSRNKLKIPKSHKVLEVGGGHNPHPRANVLVDKFIDSNYHRCGDINILKNQQFIEADGENLPFNDGEFDYVICNHVLEHVDDPTKFLNEQTRVARRGYLETPSLIGEILAPKKSHKWLILEIDGKIVLFEKEKVNFQISHDFGELFLYFLPTSSIGYKIVERTHGNILTVRFEWEENIEYLINPTEDKYLKYFTEPWSMDMCRSIFPTRSYSSELWASARATVDIATSLFKSKILKKQLPAERSA